MVVRPSDDEVGGSPDAVVVECGRRLEEVKEDEQSLPDKEVIEKASHLISLNVEIMNMFHEEPNLGGAEENDKTVGNNALSLSHSWASSSAKEITKEFESIGRPIPTMQGRSTIGYFNGGHGDELHGVGLNLMALCTLSKELQGNSKLVSDSQQCDKDQKGLFSFDHGLTYKMLRKDWKGQLLMEIPPLNSIGEFHDVPIGQVAKETTLVNNSSQGDHDKVREDPNGNLLISHGSISEGKFIWVTGKSLGASSTVPEEKIVQRLADGVQE
ncbi:hypothetical protein VNO78_20966 [Psophocarpus tetragonolobus]|uniref:Uncharacterized protein n=1 Tax=Psophocarpus tetragonolobus TaxID=3891 RepID=A0AAN9SAC0_PSOTE